MQRATLVASHNEPKAEIVPDYLPVDFSTGNKSDMYVIMDNPAR